jgi:hypothetical protein
MNVENAIRIIRDLNQSTIIDFNWYDYIKGTVVLSALLKVANVKTYKMLLQKYEGNDLETFLSKK